MQNSAYLVGPFVGELEWEMYRFAPYIIHLKKENPENKLIVCTRPSRFDLYGNYANIIIPLNLKDQREHIEVGFGIKNFDYKYGILIDYFFKKYKKRYTITDHIFPNIRTWRKDIKWQFPRSKMDYDFKPRKQNYSALDGLYDTTTNVFVDINDSDVRHKLFGMGYNPIMRHWLIENAKYENNLKVSYIGCLIVLLRTCKFVVANINSKSAKLALLLKIPVISIDEKMTYDSIKLLNPFNVPVINCYTIEEGIHIYENNI